jgi:hypothetical protein
MSKLKIYILSLILVLSTQTLQAKVNLWGIPLTIAIICCGNYIQIDHAEAMPSGEMQTTSCPVCSMREEHLRAFLKDELFDLASESRYRDSFSEMLNNRFLPLTPDTNPEDLVQSLVWDEELAAALIEICSNPRFSYRKKDGLLSVLEARNAVFRIIVRALEDRLGWECEDPRCLGNFPGMQ